MKITKNELRQRCIDNETAIATLETLLKEHGITRKKEPKLKQLDQSVFDGLDEDVVFAVVKSNGEGMAISQAPFLTLGGEFWGTNMSAKLVHLGASYDASDWQNSLIERDKVELTGSDLCRAMLERGDKFVMCGVSKDGQDDTMLDGYYAAIESVNNHGRFYGYPHHWLYVTPINNQGEPLTATDVGL